MEGLWNHTIKSKFHIFQKSSKHYNGFRADFNIGKCVLYFKERNANYKKGNKGAESIIVVTTGSENSQFVKSLFSRTAYIKKFIDRLLLGLLLEQTSKIKSSSTVSRINWVLRNKEKSRTVQHDFVTLTFWKQCNAKTFTEDLHYNLFIANLSPYTHRADSISLVSKRNDLGCSIHTRSIKNWSQSWAITALERST